jgi:capsular polysaccharide biosynthesis protein
MVREGALSRIFHVASYDADERARIARLIGFDPEFYLAEYPDVAAAGVDPLTHFLSQGVNELRLPARLRGADGELDRTLGFDPAFYAARYPDAASDPQGHFLSCGARERRLPFDLVDNLTSERLLDQVLDRLGVPHPTALEAPAQYAPEHWLAVPDELHSGARRTGIAAKPYRNNFWLGMAVGLLAQGRFGAAVCCYNFFFNYYLPARWLGNGQNGMIGAGRIAATAEAIAADGEQVAMPAVAGAVKVPDPVFLNRAAATAPPVELKLPQPVYGVLSNVEAIGGTSLMVRGAHTILYDYTENGERARELQCPNIVHVIGDHCSFQITTRTIEVEEAFSLLHDHGHNYHHWLLEVLPRYLLALRCGMAPDMPLLVEGHMAPQMREILRHVAGAEPSLIEVPRGMSAQVRRLHCMSDLCANSVHTTREPRREDILFSPTAIRMLRELAAPHFADLPGKYDNMLVLRTNVSFRRVVNRAVLQAAMKRLGLWGFDPGSASWADQVRAFSNARLIVSEAGAALANLVFCRPGAVVIVLVNGHRNSNYFYLAQLASLVGVRLYIFDCHRLAGSHAIAVQDDMIAPVGALADWVRRFMAAPDLDPRAGPVRPRRGSKHPAPTGSEVA